MQKIQFGLRQEHVVYLNASDVAAVAALAVAAAAADVEAMADVMLLVDVDGRVDVEVVGFSIFLQSSSSGSESIKIISKIRIRF